MIDSFIHVLKFLKKNPNILEVCLIFNTRGNTNAKLDSNSVDQKQQNSCD